MKDSSWEKLSFALLIVAVVVVVAVAVVVVVAVAVAVVAAVAAVVAVAVTMENPKTACGILSIIIVVCIGTLFFALPIALNPPQTIEVICQVTQTSSPIIIIHNSTTITVTNSSTVNQTMTEILSRSYTCP